MARDFETSDWVRIQRAGIWQVYRTLSVKCLDPVTRSETTRDILFAKRFVTDAFRNSFSQDCCAPQLAHRLSPNDQKKLNSFIEENPKLVAEFADFAPKPIDNVYNARIAAPTDQTADQVTQALSLDCKITELEIQPHLEGNGFNDGFPCWTIQFVSSDHECNEKGYLVYSFERVLEF